MRYFHGVDHWGKRIPRLPLATAAMVLLAMVLCALFCVVVFRSAEKKERDRYQDQLVNAADLYARQLERELRGCLVGTKALQQFLISQGGRDRVAFSRFAKPLLAEHPEIQAFEWIPVVAESDRARFEEQMGDATGVGFCIRERDGRGGFIPAGRRDRYYPVCYVEPLAGNEMAVGYDLGSELNRRVSLDLATTTGQIQMTGRIRLVQEHGSQYGFLLFAPVFKVPNAVATAEGGDPVLEGFALGVFRAGDIMLAAMTPAPSPNLSLAFIDLSVPVEQACFHNVESAIETGGKWYDVFYPFPKPVLRGFTFAGRRLGVQIVPDRAFVRQHYSVGYYLLLPAGFVGSTLLGMLVYWLDISRRKHKGRLHQRVTQLVRTKVRQQQIAERLPVGVIEWDANFCVRRWNPAAENIFGYTASEALGRHAGFIIAGPARESVDKVWHELLSQSGGLRSTNENLTKSGRVIQCEWHNLPQLREDGMVIGVTSFVEDISARREAQRHLMESEFKHRTLFETMSQGGIYRDATGCITSVNPATLSILGVGSEDLLGRDYSQLPFLCMDPDGNILPVAEQPSFKAMVSGEAVYNQLMRFGLRCGRTVWALVTAIPLSVPGNSGCTGTYTSFTDITGLMEAEKALENSMLRIQRINAVLRSIDAVDRLLASEKDEFSLLSGVCRILVEVRGYASVWVGKPDHVSKRVLPVASAGMALGALHDTTLTWDVGPSGGGTCGVAIRERRPVVEVPASQASVGEGDAVGTKTAMSVASLPLLSGNQLWGVITARSDSLDAFDLEELDLLASLTRKIAGVLQVNASEAAHARTRHDLQVREEQYQTLLASAMDGFWVIDIQGHILDCNQACCDLLGYSRDELLQCTVPDVTATGSREEFHARLARIVASGHARFEAPHRRSDGSLVEVEVSAHYIPQMGGRLYVFLHDISGRKQAEMLQKRYQLFLQHARDAILLVNLKGCIVEANAAAQAMYGYSYDEMLGMQISALRPYAPPDLIRWQMEIARREGILFETRHIRSDGSPMTVEVSSCGVDVMGDELLLSIIRDVSARKQAEVALRESETRFRQISAVTGELIWEVNADGLYTYVSSSCETMLGYAPDDMVGKLYFHDLFPLANRGQLKLKALDMIAGRGSFIGFEHPFQTRDGRVIDVITSGIPYFDAVGEFVGYRGSDRDVSAQRVAEEEVRRTKESFKTLVEKAADCFVLADCSGLITYVSPPVFAMTGRLPDELVGHPVLENVSNESRATAEEVWTRLLEHPEGAVAMDLRVRHKDGTWRLLSGVAQNLLSHETVNGILINFQDVTARDSLERQLRQAQKMEAIGTLAGGIAHDFNNMLFAIMGFAAMAAERVENDAQLSSDLDQILEASKRSADLVKQLLIFSRQVEKERVEVAVMPIIKETSRLLRATLPATIEIRQEFVAEHDVVMSDPVQIQQIIMNLGTNAYHAMRPRGGVLTLRLETVAQATAPRGMAAPHGWLKLSVTDTGHGIDPAIMDRLFEPFFSTKAVGEGTGLGLAVVHGIVTASSGFIEVESVVNQGTTFKIYLPLLSVVDKPEGDGVARVSPPPGNSRHVLCVDDERLLTEMLKRTIESLGYRVTVFNSGPAALNALRRDPSKFDVLLTDHTMPGMTGLSVIEVARNLRPDLPAILLTGYDSENVSISECRRFGALLRHKPISAESLGNALHVALHR